MKKLFSFILCVLTVILCLGTAGLIAGEFDFFAPDEPAAAVELTQIGSPYKFYYNNLSEPEKLAYNKILSEIYSMPESVQINEIDDVQLKRVFSALLSDNPDLFFLGRRSTMTKTDNVFTFIKKESKTSFSVDYIVESADEYNKMRASLNAACSKALEGVDESWSDWEKEKYVHDYIVDNCRYVLNEDDYIYSSAYGVLVNGEASCEGYSKAAKLLLDKLGIENGVISGTVNENTDEEAPHMWNAVNVDGAWYHLDCTWDDPVDEETDEQTRTYYFFNLSDDMIAPTHTDFSISYNCTETDGYYFIKEGRYFESYDRQCEERVAQLIANQLESGEKNLEIQFADKEAYDAASKDLIENQRYYNVYKKAKQLTDIDFRADATNYAMYEERLVIRLVPILE